MAKKLKKRTKTVKRKRKKYKPRVEPTGELSIYMETRRHDSRKKWTDKKIRSFDRYFRARKAPKQIAKLIAVSESSLATMKSELKRASLEGHKNLNDYLKAGRPCQYGAKKLA